jgi:HEAT repeat protein
MSQSYSPPTQLKDASAVGALIAAIDGYEQHPRRMLVRAAESYRGSPRYDHEWAVIREWDNVQVAVVRALGDIGDPSALGALIAVLNDADSFSRVQAAAAKALGQVVDASAVEPLIAVLSADYSDEAQAAAARALGQLGDASAVGPLITALEDIRVENRGGHWIALTVRKRKAAASALGKIGDPRAVGPLIAALDEGFTRAEATEALVMLGDAAVEPLIAVLQARQVSDGIFDGLISVAEILGKIGDSRAEAPLTAALDDTNANLRDAAAAALRQFQIATGDT